MFKKQKDTEQSEQDKKILDFQTKNRLSAPLPTRAKKEWTFNDFEVV